MWISGTSAGQRPPHRRPVHTPIHELEQKQIVNDALIVDTDEISAASEPEVSEKLAPAGA